jgi:hypothetical protein
VKKLSFPIASIGKELPALIVMDEFQDIAFVEEAEAKFRAMFQELHAIPVILMGSKRHILSRLFARPEAPLASFGQDLEFHPIAFDAYHRYIEERFASRSLTIDLPTATILQERFNRIPESVNIICAHLLEQHEHTAITETMVAQAVMQVVSARQSRFEQHLADFTDKEEEILISVAKNGPIRQFNGTAFLRTVHASARMVGLIFRDLRDRSILEKDAEGYRIADPLLQEYLRVYR